MPWEGRRYQKAPYIQPIQPTVAFLFVARHSREFGFFGRVNGRHGWGVFDLPTVFDGAKSRSNFLGFFRENDVRDLRSFDYLEWILIFSGRESYFFWEGCLLFFLGSQLNWIWFLFFVLLNFFDFCFWLLTIILIIFFFLKFQIHHLVNLFRTVA